MQKTAWLAVRDADPTPALGLTELGEVDWRTGLDLAYFTPGRVLVTPPVDGWTVVLDLGLLVKPAPTVALSATLDTEVQSFTSHRGLQVYRWQRARSGELLRSFAYADGETAAIGEASALEESFGELVDEADVYRVAAQWSVDPRTLDVRCRVCTGTT